MKGHEFKGILSLSVISLFLCFSTGCGVGPVGTNVNLANSSTNTGNSAANLTNTHSTNSNTAQSTVTESKEPQQYQAAVTVKIESVGARQNVGSPTLTAATAVELPVGSRAQSIPGPGEMPQSFETSEPLDAYCLGEPEPL